MSIEWANVLIRALGSKPPSLKKMAAAFRTAVVAQSARLKSWANKPRPWVMPLCVFLMALGYWAQLHGHGLPITFEQWSQK
ncbi:MAG: hypothetical protein ACXWC4_03325 [Telluria sp.]